MVWVFCGPGRSDEHSSSVGHYSHSPRQKTDQLGCWKRTEADLATKLSRFLFNYRIKPNDSTGASPTELMFKRQLRTRLDLLNPSMHDRVIAKQTKMKARYDVNTRPRVVEPNESVYTRLEHETNWCPAVVRTSEWQIVGLELEDGRIVRRHLDQVRSRTDTASGEFGKFELLATFDRDPDIPRTEKPTACTEHYTTDRGVCSSSSFCPGQH
nr:unnamed protein product [Spirometra erinaceieuropaei]